jgi:phosphopantothenoylcysteine synthetase/decarboxylase
MLETLDIETFEDLLWAIHSIAGRNDIKAVVHAMAVLDYIPESTVDGKKPSGDERWDIRLVKTPKVIGMLRILLPEAFFIGFKLESGISDKELISRASALLETNNLDLVVANLLDRIDEDRHEALFVGSGGVVAGRYETKSAIAEALADTIAEACR